MFKYSIQKSGADLFKSTVSKTSDVKGYEKAASNMNGSKVNGMVNSCNQPRKSISMANIKK